MKSAIFYDRDGVLNDLVRRDGGEYSPQTFNDFKIAENALEVTKYTSSKGFLNIVISNQPDVSRGALMIDELNQMTKLLVQKLFIDEVFYCKHDDSDKCQCRKPDVGLILKASSKLNIDLNKSYLIGDSWKDIEAARKANVKSFLLDRHYNNDYKGAKRIKSLLDVVSIIGKY
jgi:D-glycero-D-manno-heptose 1,7-bisphosphate phosphatase